MGKVLEVSQVAEVDFHVVFSQGLAFATEDAW